MSIESVEPLIIFKNSFREKWVHPGIEEISKTLSKDLGTDYNYSGPLMRFVTDDIQIVALLDQAQYDFIIEEMIAGISASARQSWAIEMLRLYLYEDFWMPGGEQFCFSEFAEDFPEYSDFEVEWFSPDVCLNSLDGWGFET